MVEDESPKRFLTPEELKIYRKKALSSIKINLIRSINEQLVYDDIQIYLSEKDYKAVWNLGLFEELKSISKLEFNGSVKENNQYLIKLRKI